jgi:hypothetical protein
MYQGLKPVIIIKYSEVAFKRLVEYIILIHTYITIRFFFLNRFNS